MYRRVRDPFVQNLRDQLALEPESVELRLELALACAGRRYIEAASDVLQNLADDLSARLSRGNGMAVFVEPLADLVEYEDARLRQAAAGVLGRMGDGRAVAALTRLGALGPDPFDFDAAFTALLEMDEDAVGALTLQAVSGDDAVSRFAVFVLGALGLASHDALVELYHRRVRQADVLAAMAAAGAHGGLECAIDALGQGNGLAYPAVTLILALADHSARHAVPPLIAILRNESGVVASLAADALAEIRDARAQGPLQQALGSDDPQLRARAARALGRLGNSAALAELRLALDDHAIQVRAAAAGALLDLLAPSSPMWSVALETLGEIAVDLVETEAREVAVEALGRHEAGWHRLRMLAQGGDPGVRLAALLAMMDLDMETQPQELLDALTLALDSNDPDVRIWALENLYRIADTFDNQDLLEMVVTDPDPEVRAALAGAVADLAGMGRIEPLPLLRVLMHDPEEWVRCESVAGLCECGPQALELLGQCSRDPAERVRGEAVSSLVAIGGEAATSLIRFLYDPETGRPRDQESTIIIGDKTNGQERYLMASEALQRIDTPQARAAYNSWLRRRNRIT